MLRPDAAPAVEFRPVFIDVEENRLRSASPEEADRIADLLDELP